MQNYKDLAKKLFDSQKNNFADFAQTTNSLQFAKQLQPKSYYETYKDLYYAAIVFSVLAQIATAISSYAFFADLFAPKIQNPILLVCVVVVVLAIIETMKYIVLNKALLGLFSLPKKENYVLLAFALLLSLCSVYASIVGSGNLGIDTQKVVTVKSEFDSEIATLRTEIAAIQNRNTYKGNTYISGKDKTLLHTKETQIQALQAQKDNELSKVSQANENNANTFKIGFGLFDLLFLLCTLYAWNFRRLVALETLVSVEILPNVPNLTTSEKSEPLEIAESAKPINQNAIPNQQNKIGFDYDFTHLKSKTANENHNENHNENRITCLHCGIVYVKKHHKQKYCCENCRIAAWELRTNTKLITKKS
jgi:hypothetical protein